MLYLGLGYAYGPILFAAGRGHPRRRAANAGPASVDRDRQLLLAASGLVIGVGVVAGTRDATEFISVAAWLVIPAAVGITINVRRDAAAEVRREQASRAVSEERLRLAQEVHDVAGHGFAVIAMQAGVALRVLDQDPAAARPRSKAFGPPARRRLAVSEPRSRRFAGTPHCAPPPASPICPRSWIGSARAGFP